MSESDSVGSVVDAVQDITTSAVIETNPLILRDHRVDQKLGHLGYFVARIDRDRVIDSKDSLLAALDATLRLPDYFGFNWDALADSLMDFSWQPAKGYVLIFMNPQSLDKKDARVFLEIIDEVGKLWGRDGVPFKLLVPWGFLGTLSDTGSELKGIPVVR
jgi:RNAse (barnase) inhibitor barstar